MKKLTLLLSLGAFMFTSVASAHGPVRQKLEQEIKQLKHVERPSVIESISTAREFGDLSENAEYHQAREDQGKLEDRINQIEYMLQSATVVKKKAHSTKVEIGATVVVKKDISKTPMTFHIVGAEEADMATGKISNRSPLGQSLFGKEKGAVISISTPKGVVKYTILEIQ